MTLLTHKLLFFFLNAPLGLYRNGLAETGISRQSMPNEHPKEEPRSLSNCNLCHFIPV